MDPMVRNDLAPAVRGHVASSVLLTEHEQDGYEKFLMVDLL